MTRHQPPEARKRQILDAAAACFASAGFQATRMEDIAEKCSLSKGALYHQFDSKIAIVLALAARWVERVVAEVSHRSTAAGPDLIVILDAPLFVVLLAESARQDELRALLADGMRQVTQAVGEHLAPQEGAQWDALMTLALGAMVRSTLRAKQVEGHTSELESVAELLKALRSSAKPRYRVQYVESR